MGKIRNNIIGLLLSFILTLGFAHGQDKAFVRNLISLEFDSAELALNKIDGKRIEVLEDLLKLWSHAGHMPLRDSVTVQKFDLKSTDPYDQLVLGIYYLFRSERGTAISYLLRSSKQFEESGSVYQVVCDIAILHLYSRIIISGDDYINAIDRFREKAVNDSEMAWYHIHKLTYLEKIIDLPKGDSASVKAFNLAKKFFQEHNLNHLLQAHFLKKKAVFLRYHKEDYVKALEAFQLSNSYCENNHFVHYMKFLNYLHISGLVRKLNREGAMNYIDSAKMLWDPSDTITAAFNYNSVLAYKHYEPNEMWDSAYYAIKRMSQESLRRYFISNNVLTTEYRERVEAEQREAEILNQMQEIESRNTLLLFISILSLLLACLVFTLAFTYQKIKYKNQRIETLIKELHHRVKNNLQVISSLLGLQSMKLENESAKKAVSEGKGRIRAMSLIHQKLYQNEEVTKLNIKEYIINLVTELATAYGYQKAQILIVAPNDPFDAETTLPLGLIINELATNCFKYAFKFVESPSINVILDRRNSQFELILEDNGPGLPQGFKLEDADSFGLKLVNLLIKQLKGSVEYSAENGARFKILFDAV